MTDIGETKSKDGSNPKKLMEIFNLIEKSDIGELNKILESSEIKEKTMNTVLARAFSVYKSTNEPSKDIIAALLK